MHRRPDSHKGEHGKIAVIGGSVHQHGAPIISALAAEASGADLVFLALPGCHGETAKAFSLNFQVYPFREDDLSKNDLPMLIELLATMDCAVIGPGLARDPASLSIIRQLITACPCPMVVDASALQEWTMTACAGRPALVTPHAGELERMNIDPTDIGGAAKRHGVIILAKGMTDRIAGADGRVSEVSGGNPGLTVGGTGDALAGLAGGLIAQGMDMVSAATMASTVIKQAGDHLYRDFGFAYGSMRVIMEIPRLLKTIAAH